MKYTQKRGEVKRHDGVQARRITTMRIPQAALPLQTRPAALTFPISRPEENPDYHAVPGLVYEFEPAGAVAAESAPSRIASYILPRTR